MNRDATAFHAIVPNVLRNRARGQREEDSPDNGKGDELVIGDKQTIIMTPHR
jgi:hypothetical protein